MYFIKKKKIKPLEIKMSAEWNASHNRGSHPSIEEQVTMKNFLAPNVKSEELEKPWFNIMEDFTLLFFSPTFLYPF